jgi:DNA polymerase bacteriophage-type
METRSAARLGKGKHGVGARAYAEHPTTETLCVAYARGNGPIEIWLPREPIPEVVLTAAADPDCLWVAHHAAFERAILDAQLVQYGWPRVPVERHVCTMILALAHSYPGSLERVAAVLGSQQQKDMAAQRAVKRMFKPRRPRRDEDANGLYWEDAPELRALLYRYAKQDMAVMREVHYRLAPLPQTEQEVAVIDAEINDVGVLIDAPLAQAASGLAVRALADLNASIARKTKGAVATASQAAKLKEWLKSQGVKLPRKLHSGQAGLQWQDSLDGDDIEKLLADELPSPDVRDVLEIRLQAAQSAASKIDRMLLTRCADGRVRNVYRMNGARTGRWSGEGFQPQNLKRPEILKSDEAVAEAIKMVLANDYAFIKRRHGDVLRAIGDLGRSMLVPAPEHRFIVGDFSAIEARVLTWLADDSEKLNRFQASDDGRGRELYCETAEQVLGLNYEVTGKSPERALGKVFELGLGYQMGGGRLLVTIRKGNVPGTEGIGAKETTHWVEKWRRQNPKIVAFWAALDATARAAVRNPEMIIPCGPVQLQMCDGVLCLRLPSGRELKYPSPTLKPGRFGQQQVTFLNMEAGARRGEQMYGGKWAENVTSAVARDLLVEAMKRLRAAGYRLVTHTHDEIVAEMPTGTGSAEEFKQLLVEVPAWAAGLPIAAKVFEANRFKKD